MPAVDTKTAGFGHLAVVKFTTEKSAYKESNPEYGGLPTFEFSGWASLEVPDGDDEVIEVGFFDAKLDGFRQNPVMRWMHTPGDVCGRWADIRPVPGQGYAAAGVAIDFGGEEDKRRLNMLRTGSVGSLSVGFNAYRTPEYGYWNDETKRWHWTQNGELMEISPCDIPCCPGAAIQLAKSRGFTVVAEEPMQATIAPDPDSASKPSLVVPEQQNQQEEPEATKSDESTSFAANVAQEEVERDVWDVIDGLWSPLVDTLRAILETDGDKTALIQAMGSEFAAEVIRRLALPGAAPTLASDVLSRAIDELTEHRKAAAKPTEEERVLSDIHRLKGAAEAIRNFARHATAEGGAPSALVADATVSPITALAEVCVKVGRVLSEATRQQLLAAIATLQSVIDAADGIKPSEEDGCSGTDDDDDKPKSADCGHCEEPPGAQRVRVLLRAIEPEQTHVTIKG